VSHQRILSYSVRLQVNTPRGVLLAEHSSGQSSAHAPGGCRHTSVLGTFFLDMMTVLWQHETTTDTTTTTTAKEIAPTAVAGAKRPRDEWAGCSLELTIRDVGRFLSGTVREPTSQSPVSDDPAVTPFDSKSLPSISIRDYFEERLMKLGRCSLPTAVVAVIYLDRVLKGKGGAPCSINFRNSHRLLLSSVLLAAKLCEDRHYNNAAMAEIGGISTSEINQLEVLFLKGVGFNLMVSKEEFAAYCAALQQQQKPLTEQTHAVLNKGPCSIRAQHANGRFHKASRSAVH